LAALRSEDKPLLGRYIVALLPWEEMVEDWGLEEKMVPEGRVAVRAETGRWVGAAVGTAVATVGKAEGLLAAVARVAAQEEEMEAAVTAVV